MEFPGGPVVKDLVSLLWLGSQLWCKFDSWPGKLRMTKLRPKKKKEEEEEEKKNIKVAKQLRNQNVPYPCISLSPHLT